MPKDKAEEPTRGADAPEIMTVEDFARNSNVNAIMLAGFKAAIRHNDPKPWRTRDEWKRALDAFSNAPA